MVDYVRTVLYLGNRPIADTLEGANNGATENTAALLGNYTPDDGFQLTTITLRDLEGLTPGSAPNGSIDEDVTNYIEGGILNPDSDDRVLYNIGAGTVTARLDMVQLANARFTLGDGSTLTVNNLVIVQMTNGAVFLAEHPSLPSTLDNIKVQSVQILAVNTTNYINWTLPPDITGSEIVCFATGTLIDTEHGPIPVEDLEIGMNVRTLDRGLQAIRWLGSRRLTSAELAVNEKLRPIRIRRGVLAENVPDRDLTVSPQHRILVSSPIAQRMFGAREVLVAAKQLLVLDGVQIADDIGDVTYHHFLFDRHEIVTSNGAMTESLFPGGEALKAVGPEAREEIFAIFPEWRDNPPHFEAAREFPAAHQARKLALRHQQNGKPLFASD